MSRIDEEERCICLQWIGIIHRDLGNWDEAARCFQNALAIAQKQESESNIASSNGLLGDIERNRGNWDAAETLYQQCLEVETELGDRSGMANIWGQWGDIEKKRGNWDAAETLYRQSLEVMIELGERSDIAQYYSDLGKNECDRGNLKAAEQFSKQALVMAQELGITHLVADVNYELKIGRRGDNLTPHHIPSNAFMQAKVPGYTKDKGIAIMMEHLSFGNLVIPPYKGGK